MLLIMLLSALATGAASVEASTQTTGVRPADPYSMHVIVTEAAAQLRDRTYGPWRVTRVVPHSPVLKLELEMVKPVSDAFWSEMEQRLTLWHCSTDATAIFAGGGRLEIRVEDPVNERSQAVTLTKCPS